MGFFVDIPKPKAWPPPKDPKGIQTLLAYGYQRDPVGDKVHTAFACLFLLCLPLATYPPDAAMLGLGVYSVLRLSSTWRTFTPLLCNRVWIAMLAWVAWSLLSIVWSSNAEQGLDHAGAMRMVGIPLLLWPVLHRWRLLIIAFLSGVALQNILQLSEVIGSWFLDGNDWISIMKNRFRDESEQIATHLSRPIGFDNHQGNAALIMAMGVVVWNCVLIAGAWSKKWALLGVTLALFGVAAAMSLAVWVGLLVGLLILCCLSVARGVQSKQRVFIVGGVLLLITVGSCLLVKDTVMKKITQVPQDITAFFDGELKTGNSIQYRLQWWKVTLQQTFDPPAVLHGAFGHGLGSVKEGIDFTTPKNPLFCSTVDHPHNFLIQILYEGGIVGVGIFFFMIWSMVHSVKTMQSKWPILSILLLSCVAVWLGAAFFDSSQNTGRTLALLVLVATAILYNTVLLGNNKKTIRA